MGRSTVRHVKLLRWLVQRLDRFPVDFGQPNQESNLGSVKRHWWLTYLQPKTANAYPIYLRSPIQGFANGFGHFAITTHTGIGTSQVAPGKESPVLHFILTDLSLLASLGYSRTTWDVGNSDILRCLSSLVVLSYPTILLPSSSRPCFVSLFGFDSATGGFQHYVA